MVTYTTATVPDGLEKAMDRLLKRTLILGGEKRNIPPEMHGCRHIDQHTKSVKTPYKNIDLVIILTKFIGHNIQDTIKSHYKDEASIKYANGTAGAIRHSFVEELIKLNPDLKGHGNAAKDILEARHQDIVNPVKPVRRGDRKAAKSWQKFVAKIVEEENIAKSDGTISLKTAESLVPRIERELRLTLKAPSLMSTWNRNNRAIENEEPEIPEIEETTERAQEIESPTVEIQPKVEQNTNINDLANKIFSHLDQARAGIQEVVRIAQETMEKKSEAEILLGMIQEYTDGAAKKAAPSSDSN
jgi:hypothetical protein